MGQSRVPHQVEAVLVHPHVLGDTRDALQARRLQAHHQLHQATGEREGAHASDPVVGSRSLPHPEWRKARIHMPCSKTRMLRRSCSWPSISFDTEYISSVLDFQQHCDPGPGSNHSQTHLPDTESP